MSNATPAMPRSHPPGSSRVPHWIAAFALLWAVPVDAAVSLRQRLSINDTSGDMLESLSVVRGSTPKRVVLEVNAAPGETWTLTTSAPWMVLSTASGTGPGIAFVRFDAALLSALDDPSANVLLVGGTNPVTNRERIDVRVDLWPERTAATAPADLRAFVKQQSSWPSDVGFAQAWHLFGFLPDDSTHAAPAPGETTGANVDSAERTACAAGAAANDPACIHTGEAGLAAGNAADLGWLLFTGAPRNRIAVLSTGIAFGDVELVDQVALNPAELAGCAPLGADLTDADLVRGFDVNLDGAFNIRDYDQDAWVHDLNGNGLQDAQDLIWGHSDSGACSDGIDSDGNGYVDDIAGWDFVWNDNDPSDDTASGLGNAEARAAAGRAQGGDDAPGVCPLCQVVPIRVADRSRASGDALAAGLFYAVAVRSTVASTGLGVDASHPLLQAATDDAVSAGIPLVTARGDFGSSAHTLPSALRGVIAVTALHPDTADFRSARTFLRTASCASFGETVDLAVASPACTGTAAALAAGALALAVGAREDAFQRSGDPFLAAPLTALELRGLITDTADDVQALANAMNEADPARVAHAGTDAATGAGRLNVAALVAAVRNQRVPPEAALIAPAPFATVDPLVTRSIEVRARVSSPRLVQLRWTLRAGIGADPRALVDVASGTGPLDPADDVLGNVPLTAEGPLGALVAQAGRSAPDGVPPVVTLELRAAGDNPAGVEVSTSTRTWLSVQADRALAPHFPLDLGSSVVASPKLVDLDGDGRDEIIVGDAAGQVHAIGGAGTELVGFPRMLAQRRADLGGRPDPGGGIAGIAVADLDGDSTREVIVTMTGGTLHVLSAIGQARDGFPVTAAFAPLRDEARARTCAAPDRVGCAGRDDRRTQALTQAPLLLDLDGDGALEIVAGSGDGAVHAWHADGSAVDGWPVVLADPARPAVDMDGTPLRVRDGVYAPPTWVRGPSGEPLIAVGAAEEALAGSPTGSVYLLDGRGNARVGGALLPGWPVVLPALSTALVTGAHAAGVAMACAAVDLDGDDVDELIVAPQGGSIVVLNVAGEAVSTLTAPLATGRPLVGFRAPVALGDLDRDGVLDISAALVSDDTLGAASVSASRAPFGAALVAWNGKSPHDTVGQAAPLFGALSTGGAVVADLDGSSGPHRIFGDAAGWLHAIDRDGAEPAGFPKWTHGGLTAAPAVGDIDGDSLIDVVVASDDGRVFVYQTTGHGGGPAENIQPAIQWESAQHDARNTGNASGPLTPREREAAPDDVCRAGCCCSATPSGDHRSPERSLPLGPVALLVFAGSMLIGIPRLTKQHRARGSSAQRRTARRT